MFEEKSKDTKKKEFNKKKLIKTISIIAIVIVVITFCLLYQYNEHFKNFSDKYIFRKDVYENNLATIEIDNFSNTKVYAYNKYIVVLNNNNLAMYNNIGKNEGNIEITISTPIFNSNGNYLCIAEQNSQKAYLISGTNIIWQKDLEGNISNIVVNKNGYVSVSISNTSYKSIIITFDQKGNELFKTYLSDSYAIDMALSNDNKYLAVAETNFSGTVIESIIKIISIEKAKDNPTEAIIYNNKAETNDLIINIEYNNKNLVCLYDNKINIIKNNEEISKIEFLEDLLYVDIGLTEKIVQITKKNNGLIFSDAELKIINSDTQKDSVYTLENIPKSVKTYGNIVCANMGVEALFINSTGWVIKKYTSTKEIQEIILSDNIAGIIYKNKIEIIKL